MKLTILVLAFLTAGCVSNRLPECARDIEDMQTPCIGSYMKRFNDPTSVVRMVVTELNEVYQCHEVKP